MLQLQQTQDEIIKIFQIFEEQGEARRLVRDSHNANILARFILDFGGHFSVENLNFALQRAEIRNALHWRGESTKVVEKIVEKEKPVDPKEVAKRTRDQKFRAGFQKDLRTDLDDKQPKPAEKTTTQLVQDRSDEIFQKMIDSAIDGYLCVVNGRVNHGATQRQRAELRSIRGKDKQDTLRIVRDRLAKLD